MAAITVLLVLCSVALDLLMVWQVVIGRQNVLGWGKFLIWVVVFGSVSYGNQVHNRVYDLGLVLSAAITDAEQFRADGIDPS